jgi:hypothetical protein
LRSVLRLQKLRVKIYPLIFFHDVN